MESLKLDNKIFNKKIESTSEYMKKLFIMPDSSDRFVEFGIHLIDMIHDFFPYCPEYKPNFENFPR